MCGGALPVHGGVVLSTERMTRIKEIDPGDLLAVVLPFLHGAGWVSNWRFLGSQLLMSGNAGVWKTPHAIQQHTEL